MINCVVLDESEIGARLKLTSALGVPHTFNLQVMNEPAKPCDVVWRGGSEIGIAYK